MQWLGLDPDWMRVFNGEMKMVDNHQIKMGNKAVLIFQQVVNENPEVFVHTRPLLWRDNPCLTPTPTQSGWGKPVASIQWYGDNRDEFSDGEFISEAPGRMSMFYHLTKYTLCLSQLFISPTHSNIWYSYAECKVPHGWAAWHILSPPS